MMVEQAVVIGYQNGIAKVQCYSKSGCGSCSAQTCGTKALSAIAGEKFAPQFSLEVNQTLQVGDKIEIGLAEQQLLQSIVWLYAIPLGVMVLSTLILSIYIVDEIVLALGIIGCTLATFSGVKRMLARQPQAQFTPIFLRKI